MKIIIYKHKLITYVVVVLLCSCRSVSESNDANSKQTNQVIPSATKTFEEVRSPSPTSAKLSADSTPSNTSNTANISFTPALIPNAKRSDATCGPGQLLGAKRGIICLSGPNSNSDKFGSSIQDGLNMINPGDRETVVKRVVEAIGIDEARQLKIEIWNDKGKGYIWPSKGKGK